MELILLLTSAFSIGLIHTLLGPDHYIPFIAMSKARKWSLPRTAVITTLCGIGHVMSAFFIGLIGVSLGFAISKLNLITSYGGQISAWFLICFGLLYFIWGMRNAVKNRTHRHFNEDGSFETHHHGHDNRKKSIKEITPWILFTIFILGPCEPLIPLIVYPAIKGQKLQVLLVTLLFGLATLTAMLTMVIGSIIGTQYIRFPFFEKYGNAVAGIVIFGTGCVIKIFGL